MDEWRENNHIPFLHFYYHNIYYHIILHFCILLSQGEQLCRILQLQIFPSLLGLLATVLPVHCRNGFTVFYQILDSKHHNLCTVLKHVKLPLYKKSKISRCCTTRRHKSLSSNHSPLLVYDSFWIFTYFFLILKLCRTSMQLFGKHFTMEFTL